MAKFVVRLVLAVVLLGAAAWLGWAIYSRVTAAAEDGRGRGGPRAAPVEVTDVTVGKITERRTFSGTLEATAQFVIAPEVGGRIKELRYDLSDRVERNKTAARLDSQEYDQALAQAEAEKLVAEANLTDARNALTIADRELERMQKLRERGVASDSQFDVARADQLAKSARVKVAEAEVTRAVAMVETAKIRLGYTDVKARWTEGDDFRVVAERFVDEGETVAAKQPLLRIVELSPITGVIHVAEKDYGRLRTGQAVTLTTDAWPGVEFDGTIARIAPVFRQASRQARVELTIPNTNEQLKPGMFIRATVVLAEQERATIVPAQTLATRRDKSGVFLVDDGGETVSFVPVEAGIREGDRVQIVSPKLSGRVVTLGQQMLDDGSAIRIPPRRDAAPATRGEGAR